MATTKKASPYYVWSIVFEFHETKLSKFISNKALTVIWTREAHAVEHVAKKRT